MEEKQNKKYISQNVYGWGSNNLGQLGMTSFGGGGNHIPQPKLIMIPQLSKD